MARRIFFSFHYQRDIFRVNTVRNSDVTKKNVESSGYWDHSLWEESKQKGDSALRKLITDGLQNTSVSVTLAGAETYLRPWVRFEIVKSFERGSGLITVFVNGIKDLKTQQTDARGPDPLAQLYFTISNDGKTAAIQEHSTGAWKSYTTISATSLAPAARSAGKGFLSTFAKSYDWVIGNGYQNFASWIETAAKDAGR